MPAHSRIHQLPDRPDLRQLDDQARALIAEGDCAPPDDARPTIAHRYGFPSWARLAAFIEYIAGGNMGDLERAIFDEDAAGVEALLRQDPHLVHREGH